MALNIPLYKNWRIRSDKSNIILVREENDREVSEGYFETVEGAINCFISKKIKGFNATSIQGLLNSLKSLTTALNKALQPLTLQPLNLEVVEKNDACSSVGRPSKLPISPTAFSKEVRK